MSNTTSSVSTKPHAKFFGRKAVACRRCCGSDHYVNRLGGIVCLKCSPPKTEQDERGRLTIEGGVWIDPDDRFDMVDVIDSGAGNDGQERGVTSATSVPQSQTWAAVGGRSDGRHNQLQENTGNTALAWHRSSRGPDGELSEFETELFLSEELWNRHDTRIVLRGQSSKAKSESEEERRKAKDEGRLEGAWRAHDRESCPIEGSGKSPVSTAIVAGDSVGNPVIREKETIRLTRRVETFRGPLALGEYQVAGVHQDHFGRQFVNLADCKTGEIVVTGLFLQSDEFVR